MKMQEVTLSQLTGSVMIALLEQIKKKETSKSKVYRTTLRTTLLTEHFVTTSKDVHLFLGQLTEGAQFDLANLIHRHLDDKGGGLLIRKDQDEKGGWLATLGHQGHEDGSIIQLAPAW